MNLKETIRKVLREEEKKKDLSVPIKKLVDLYMENHKDKKYVCGYKFGMGKFATRHTGEVYQRFKITILFNSGYGSKRWPMTMAINTQEEEIMNELQDLILDTFGIIVDMHSTQTPNCEKIEESILKEEATDTEYAVIEILKPSSRMPQKWYFQAVPLNKTEHDKIYIKRGPAGILTISTKNIKIHKIFKKSEKEEMDKYLEKLREQDKKKEEQNEQEITEKCWKGYTQKGMKTMFGKRYPNCVKKKK